MKKTTQIEKIVAARARQRVGEGNNKLFFLFTTSQVEEILTDIVVRPLPFAPSYLRGIAFWRNSLLPVIDLEKRFAFEDRKQSGKSRFVVIRAGTKESPVDGEVFRCVLKLSDDIHPIDISASGFVVKNEQIGIESSLLRGTYLWNENVYIVPDLVSILQNQPGIEN